MPKPVPRRAPRRSTQETTPHSGTRLVPISNERVVALTPAILRMVKIQLARKGLRLDPHDVVSEIQLRLLRAPHTIDPAKGSETQYISRMIGNYLVDQMRGAKKTRYVGGEDSDEVLNQVPSRHNQVDRVIQRDSKVTLQSVMKRILTEREFHSLRLNAKGQSIRTIAKELGITRSAADSSLHRARAKMRSAFPRGYRGD